MVTEDIYCFWWFEVFFFLVCSSVMHVNNASAFSFLFGDDRACTFYVITASHDSLLMYLIEKYL